MSELMQARENSLGNRRHTELQGFAEPSQSVQQPSYATAKLYKADVGRMKRWNQHCRNAYMMTLVIIRAQTVSRGHTVSSGSAAS